MSRWRRSCKETSQRVIHSCDRLACCPSIHGRDPFCITWPCSRTPALSGGNLATIACSRRSCQAVMAVTSLKLPLCDPADRVYRPLVDERNKCLCICACSRISPVWRRRGYSSAAWRCASGSCARHAGAEASSAASCRLLTSTACCAPTSE